MDRPIRRAGIRVLVGLVLLMGISQIAWAHAILMESTPATSSTVQGPTLAISLRFNVRVDGGRSRLHLVAPDGSTADVAIAKQTSPDHLQASAAGLKPGSYKLQWQVLASDGHMSHGEIAFTVK